MKIAIIHLWLLGDEKFDHRSEITGIPGAEETLLNFSKELYRQGVEVTVFAPTKQREYVNEGVIWKDLEDLSSSAWYDITWSWSDNYNLISSYSARWPESRLRIFRLVNQQSQQELEKMFDFFQVAISQSKWLTSKFSLLGETNKIIISNGINSQEFYSQKKAIKDHKIFYGSDYDKGLIILLQEWGRLKQIKPHLTLEICYGWNVIDAKIKNMLTAGAHDNANQLIEFKNKISKMMQQEGITHHGRLGHKAVNELIQNCTIWGYPCIFPENCSTLSLKAMAGGLFPCVIRSGGLVETINSGLYPEYSLWQQGEMGDRANVNFAIQSWKENMAELVSTNTSFTRKYMERVSARYKYEYSYPRVVSQLLAALTKRIG